MLKLSASFAIAFPRAPEFIGANSLVLA